MESFRWIIEIVAAVLLATNMGALTYLVKRQGSLQDKYDGLAETVATIAERTACLPGMNEDVCKAMNKTARLDERTMSLLHRVDKLETGLGEP